MQRSWRMSVTVVSVSALAAALTACGGDVQVAVESGPKMMKPADITAAVTRSAEVTSGRFSMESSGTMDLAAVMSMFGQAGSDPEMPTSAKISVKAAGGFSGTRSESTTTIDLGNLIGDGDATPMEVSTVVDGDDIYMKVGGEWRRGVLPGGDGSLLGDGWTRLSKALKELKVVGESVEDLGGEEVRGVATVHRRITVDSESMKALVGDSLTGSLGRAVPKLLDQLYEDGDASMDLWFDDQGMIRRVAISIESPILSQQTVVELWDPGAEVKIEVPETSATMDLGGTDDLFGGFGTEPVNPATSAPAAGQPPSSGVPGTEPSGSGEYHPVGDSI